MIRANVRSKTRHLASNTIASAFAVSLMLHLILVFAVELGRKAGFWESSVLPEWVRSDIVEVVRSTEERRRQAQQQEIPEAELLFIEVDPDQSLDEPPENARYYSSHNLLAGNPNIELDLNVPKIDGRQDKVPRMMDTFRSQAEPLQPAPPPPREKPTPQPPQPARQPAPEPAERTAFAEPVAPAERPQPEGETLLARAAPRPQPQPEPKPPQEQPRRTPYRSLAQARADKGLIQGERIKQEGGVRRFAIDPGFDVKATPFGAYDLAFIQAVQTRWFSLLNERDFVGSQAGKVILEFRLNHDGRITSMRVVHSEVSQLLSWFCERAVLDPAPYMPFPSDLRRLHKTDYRDIRFTFYYNQ